MSTPTIKYALLGNALFSTLSGLSILFFYTTLNQWMGIAISWILPVIGIGLLGFAASIVVIARKNLIPRKAVISIIIQDALWVIGSTIIVFTSAFNLREPGYELITAVAVIVAGFGIWQWWYLPTPITDK